MKVAILGTENSHAMSFSKILKTDPRYADVEIVGLYGPDADNQKIIDAGYASYAAKSPDEFVGKVDAVIVTARHGDHHYDYAMPYLKAGIPAFIDKPFTVSLEKAEEMIATAKATGAKLCGGSSIKYYEELNPICTYAKKNKIIGGQLIAPINMINDYGGFYFYSAHLLAMLTRLFGYNVKSVIACAAAPEKDRVSVIFRYEDFDVTANYCHGAGYHATVITEKGIRSTVYGELGDFYGNEVAEIIDMIRNGTEKETHEELIYPVRLLNAIEKSYTTGKEVAI